MGTAPLPTVASVWGFSTPAGGSAFAVRLPGEFALAPLDLPEILSAIIATVASIILLLVVAAVYRRASRSKRYRELDELRHAFHEKLEGYLRSGNIFEKLPELSSAAGSLKWQAIEENLLKLMETGSHAEDMRKLFVELGYVSHYDRRTAKGNVITRAAAIDKLGKMRSEQSTPRLVELLRDDNPEIIAVTVRSLCRIGAPAGLEAILARLPVLLSKSLVSIRTVKNSLSLFGTAATATFVESGERYDDPMCRSLMLEILAGLSAREAVPIALANLHHPEAEVRAKALKLVGAVGNGLEDSDKAEIVRLLGDPVWFVRLQAAKSLGSLRHEKAVDNLGDALLDKSWQVRNAAAGALTRFGDRAIDVFLGTLEYKDRYAKESICEEIEKTNFVDVLIENLARPDTTAGVRSRHVLLIMTSLGYRTPLLEYLKTGTNEVVKRELDIILRQDSAR